MDAQRPGRARHRRPERQSAWCRRRLNNFFNRGGALPPTFVSVFGLTGASLANTLSQLSGEAATGAQKVGFQMESQFLNLMLDPFVDGRSGIGGADHPRSASRPNATTRRLRSHSPMPRC